jgi:hypothetical protein
MFRCSQVCWIPWRGVKEKKHALARTYKKIDWIDYAWRNIERPKHFNLSLAVLNGEIEEERN